MAKKNDSGFQSSAGLMRYFDVENEKGVRISPRAVVGIAIGLIVVVAGLMRYFDVENEKGVRISPRAVVGIAIGLIVVVMLLRVFVPL